MTNVEDNSEPDVERRRKKRVAYTAVLGFKELKGKKIPSNPKPNAIGVNLSLSGISFQSKKRPQTKHVILYLPDWTRAVARVAAVTQEAGSLEYITHCLIVRWVPYDATTLEPPILEPVYWPVTQESE